MSHAVSPEESSRPFLAVDWGSTHLRLWLLDDDPGAGALEFRSDRGIREVKPGEHQGAFLDAIGGLLERGEARERFGKFFQSSKGSTAGAAVEVYFSGMVTSTLGWVPTPYVKVPAAAGDLISGVKILEVVNTASSFFKEPVRWILHFFPGVRTADDVMRGEEVEIFGILPAAESGSEADERVAVLPGTHCKWIRCRGGRILDFVTVPTGDVHAALHRETLLARTLPPQPAPITAELRAFFERGVRAAEAAGPLSSLFKVRALAILDDLQMKPEEGSAFLSGVLIGGEVLERLARPQQPEPLRLLVGGEPGLRKLYLKAIELLGCGKRVQVEECSLSSGAMEGLRRLRKAMKNPSKRV